MKSTHLGANVYGTHSFAGKPVCGDSGNRMPTRYVMQLTAGIKGTFSSMVSSTPQK
jgi:hypothetical protein